MFEANKFRPKTSVKVLQDIEPASLNRAAKPIAFAELIAWACLGQTKRKKSKREEGSDKRKRLIRTRTALRARQLVVAKLIDRELATRTNDEVLEFLLAVMVTSGGFSALATGQSSDDIVMDLIEIGPELKYVQEIVRYLVRYQLQPIGSAHGAIQDAKEFVRIFQSNLGCQSNYGASKIGKIWEKFAPAAPYLFALFEEKHVVIDDRLELDSAIEWICRFATQQDRTMRFLGQAAWVADLLAKTSRGQRVSDFKGIQRVQPSASPFTEQEQRKIAAIDHNSPIAKPYRPKQFRRAMKPTTSV